jgi:hypothetical protein
MNEHDESLGFHHQMRMMLVSLLMSLATETLRDSAGQTPR